MPDLIISNGGNGGNGGNGLTYLKLQKLAQARLDIADKEEMILFFRLQSGLPIGVSKKMSGILSECGIDKPELYTVQDVGARLAKLIYPNTPEVENNWPKQIAEAERYLKDNESLHCVTTYEAHKHNRLYFRVRITSAKQHPDTGGVYIPDPEFVLVSLHILPRSISPARYGSLVRNGRQFETVLQYKKL
jgi:hypothetical protein